MGAGGLNGHLRNQSQQVESIFPYNIDVGREAATNFFEQTSSSSSSPAEGSEQRASSTEDGTMVCKRCSTRLCFFNKKNLCQNCGNTFCTSCFLLRGKPNERAGRCFPCRALQFPVLYKEQLIELKVKELQGYLRVRNVSTFHCKEKRELVELVLLYAQGRTTAQNIPMPAESVAQRTTQPQRQDVQSSGLESSEPTAAPTAASYSTENSDSTQETSKPLVRSLQTLKAVEEISSLSVKELKYILTANYVDFTGCCEKVELLERVHTLWKSKQEQGTTNNISGHEGGDGCVNELCKICMDACIDCVLLECGHMVTCIKCGKQLADCPICRQYISRIVHVFKS